MARKTLVLFSAVLLVVVWNVGTYAAEYITGWLKTP